MMYRHQILPLQYDPDTGKMHWTEEKTRLIPIGAEAGWIDSHGRWKVGHLNNIYSRSLLAWEMFYGEAPNMIAHVNRIKDDDRIVNLINVGSYDNMRNHRPYTGVKSGVEGVCWNSVKNRWAVNLEKEGTSHWGGYHDSLAKATKARRDLEIEHQGHSDL
jgi:hypothetical protein